MMTTNSRTKLAFLTCSFLSMLVCYSYADTSSSTNDSQQVETTQETTTTTTTITPKMQDDISYFSGGIGKDEEEALKKTQKNYSLRMSFSKGNNNEYVTGIKITIRNMHNKTIFSLEDAGPLLYVNLPTGKYKLAIQRNDQPIKNSTIVISKNGGRDVNTHWNE